MERRAPRGCRGLCTLQGADCLQVRHGGIHLEGQQSGPPVWEPSPSHEHGSEEGSWVGPWRQHMAAHRPRQTLDTLLPPDTSPEALDLLRRLLVFAPDKRLSATQALQHPYLQRFHCSSDKWARKADVRLRVHEGLQLSAPEYRSRVYQVLRLMTPIIPDPQTPHGQAATSEHPPVPQMILERGGSSCTSREKGLEGVPPGAEPRASPSQAYLCKPRANPQLSSGTPVQGPRPRPQSGPGHDPPEHGVKPSEREAASSLTSQTVAQVDNQALIRADGNWGGGVPPRPGRRMFRTSASQGAQGAARALLGGYSQAYGTVCHSALGHLPLPEGHCV
ncbi:hypothetical protein P7K49_026600 [Saguinus oedipus]|uniref:Mitogen-activated protein kinase 15 n=1 Tax=Saguinus oedipus TaxID=9490 RepID=A0ABQ9UEG1_SAGOE|nr:hypothetical protein P7K49_026600 [Saguinus oedipus]